MSVEISIKIFEHAKDLPLPQYATEGSVGMDLLAANNQDILIMPGKRELIPTGIGIALEDSYEAQIRPRSGLALKNGITVLNSPGTIDSDYRGEISIILINLGDEDFKVTRGMRIAQMIISKVKKGKLIITENLETSERGSSGFGSTGYK